MSKANKQEIKCPICSEKDFYKLGTDDRHKIRYHELLEKIQSLKKRFKYVDKTYDNLEFDANYFVKELESLLE